MILPEIAATQKAEVTQHIFQHASQVPSEGRCFPLSDIKISLLLWRDASSGSPLMSSCCLMSLHSKNNKLETLWWLLMIKYFQSLNSKNLGKPASWCGVVSGFWMSPLPRSNLGSPGDLLKKHYTPLGVSLRTRLTIYGCSKWSLCTFSTIKNFSPWHALPEAA